MSQTTDILHHLIEKGTITPWEAIKHYGSTRLGSIVFELRKRGYIIETEMIEVQTRYGRKVKIAKYHYKGEL